MLIRRMRLLMVFLAGVLPALLSASASAAQEPPHIVATLRLTGTGEASAIAVGYRSAWVSVLPNHGSAYVARIASATDHVIAKVRVPSTPGWVVGGGGMVAGEGAIWLTGEQRIAGAGLEAVLERIDPAKNQLVRTIPLGGRLGADVMVHGGFVWALISTASSSRIVKVDPGTNRVLSRIHLPGPSPRRIFAAAGALWVYDTHGVSGAPNGTLRKIDPSSGTIVSTVPLARYVGDAVPRGHVIWVAKGGELLRLRAATARFIGKPIRVARGIRATQMVAGAGGVWFSGYDPAHASVPDVIHRFDPSISKLDVSIEDTHGPSAMALGPRSLWILNYDGSLMRVDLH